MVLTNKSKKALGVMSAVGVALTQGFEGILILLFGLIGVLAISLNEPFFAGGALAAKEIMGIVIIFMLFGPKIFKSIFKKVRSKSGLFFSLAAILGTMTGNFLYIVSISLAGSSYGTILTGLYPVFSILLIKFIFKEKEGPLVILGMVISILGGLFFVITPILVSGGDMSTKTIIGIVLSAVTAFFWSIESVFIKIGLNKQIKGQEWTRQEIVTLRSVATLIGTVVVLMPFSLIWGNSFKVFADIFSHWQSFLILLAIAINIIVLRIMHVYAIDKIGGKLTALIDTNNFLVSPFVSIFLVSVTALTYPSGEPLYTKLEHWWAWLFVIPIVVGAIMTIYFHKEKDTEKFLDRTHD